jgi:ATP-dependent Clp protease ATP-binding subunit ClpA
VGNFLFLGPTGTGKTRLVEAMAESLTGNPRAVIKIDCAEFQHSHEIAKLVGSPPGYLGHRETHPVLSQEALDKYQTPELKLSFVLFDEIEKASDALWNLLLGILDKATLTLGDNRQVDFSHAVIFLTSNLGAREMMATLNPRLGFTPHQADSEALAGQVERAGIEAARRKFTPEFLNRIDKVVVFRPLGEPELQGILDIELAALRRRFQDNTAVARVTFTVTQAARGYLLEEGTDTRYGARHLKRSLERNLVTPVSNLLASGQVRTGDLIRVDYDPSCGRLLFYRSADSGEAARPDPPAETAEPAVARAETATASRIARVSVARRK